MSSAATGLSPFAEAQISRVISNWKLTPATLAHRLNPHWIPAPHLMYISSQVASAIVRGGARIVISVPPRHGKSELITKYTTTWVLEHFPWLNVILASYGAELSTDFGRKVRDIINDNKELLSINLRRDAGRANNWVTSRGGGMMSVGVNGPITGRGANVLLIDDYIKDIKEALSRTMRDSIWDWFTTTALTRVEPGGSCIIIATRWHWDDLIGRILRHNPGGRWTEISIPALVEKRDLLPGSDVDILGRHLGEPLFPERYDLDALQERLDTLGTFYFNALFQGRPENDEARLTNPAWLEVVDIVPDLSSLRLIRVWDLAATHGGGDYTVGTLLGYDSKRDTIYVLNVIRKQLSPGSVEDLVYRTAVDDGVYTEIGIEEEPGSSGKALSNHYAVNVLQGYTTHALPTGNEGGKLAKAQPLLAAAESGRVKLLKGHWNKTFIDEFADFPAGEHDDQIDTAAAGFNKLRGKRSLTASWGRNTDTSKLQQRFGPIDEKALSVLAKAGDPGARRMGVTWGRRRA